MNLSALFDSAVSFLVIFIQKVGYFGIFIGMFIESTPFPLPSEVIMIPVGIALAHNLNTMNIIWVIIFGVLGNLCGAMFSYLIAASFGRVVLLRIGKYIFISEKIVVKMEQFFFKHGTISIFIGRLLPGFRHFISLAAGISKMRFDLFCIYTTLGSIFWTSALVALGYFIGKNQELIKQYLNIIILCCIVFSAIIVFIYWLYHKKYEIKIPKP
jgi:membrane protein DedA with SNARE-associated domain